jgi:hypothetical protein
MDATYPSHSIDAFIRDHALDVARDGIYVKSKAPPEQGTLIKFYFKVESGDMALTGVGRVAWACPDSCAKYPAGFAMHFVKLDEPSSANLERMLREQATSDEPPLYQPQKPN